MRRAVFLTVILASAILAFVRASPLPKNQDDAPVDKFQNELEEIWKNVRSTMDNKYNELLEDPTVSASFLNTFNELIEEVNKANEEIIDNAKNQVNNILKSNGQEDSNVNSSQDFVLDSWYAFQERMWDQYEKCMENPKVQAVVRKIENAMRTSRDILQVVVEDTRARINAEKSKNAVQDVESEGNSFLEKAQETWKQFRHNVREKYDKYANNPKAKEIVEKLNKALDKTKESLKNIISSITKEDVTDSKSYSLEAIPEPLVAGFKQRVQEVWKDLKDNLQEKAKAIWNNPKVKEVVEKGEKAAEEAKKALRDVVENVRNEIDRISKEVEQIKDNVDTTSLKDKVQQAWNDFKKKVDEKSEEIKNNPNVKEIIEATDKAIEDAKGNVKAIIDAVQQAIDSISKEAEKVKKNADTTSLKDKVQQAWNDFKKKVEEKSEEVKNNPKVKEIIEATDKAIEDAKGNFKAIIDAVQKAIDSVSKEAEKVKKNADTTSLKDKVEQAWNDFKKKVEEKSEEVKNNPKVKEIIEATDKAIEDAKGDVKAIIDAVHKAIESISKEAEQIKDNVDTISWKEKIVKTWEDFKKKVEEKSEEVKNNPKVKEIIEATDKAIEDAKGDVKAIIDAVHKAIESISKEGEKVEENADATSWKEKVKGAWNDFKKKVDQKSEEIKNNPKVKEIIEATDKAIENAKGEAKEIVDAVHKAIDNISIRSYEVLAEPAGHDSVKEKLEKAWNNFKKIIADKVDEIIRDPKTKEILDKSEKVINEAHENAKNIIESIRKAADESSKNTDENSAKSVANIYVSNVKEAWESFKRKIAATYNNVWEKQKVKTAIDDGERTLLRIQDSAQDVVDAIRRELEKSHDNSQ